MNKYFSIFLLATTLCCTSLIAQTVSKSKSYSPPDESSIVIDSSGVRYDYVIWKKLLSTGKYKMTYKKVEGKPTTYYLSEMTEKDLILRSSNMTKPKESPAFVEGTSFDYFNVKDLNKEKFSKEELKNKVLVINFWFVKCPPCKQEIPDLNKMVEGFENEKDVIFVAVGLDEDWEIKEFLKETPFKYHQIAYGRTIANKFGVKGYPTHVVVDRTGNIKFSTLGLGSNTLYWLKKSIEDSLKL